MFDNVLPEWISFFKQNNLYDEILKILNDVYSIDNTLPAKKDVLKIFTLIKPQDIKVVILGQDPYHTPGVANGIAFSTNSKKTPPSLKNIFKELKNDLNIERKDNDLSDWVSQGVFLINTVWTVAQGIPNSHIKYGWIEITIKILKKLSELKSKLIYCLFGNNAKELYKSIDNDNDIVLKYSHPSPFSFKKDFENRVPFSTINMFIYKNHLGDLINW